MPVTLEERFILLEAEVARLRTEVESQRQNTMGKTRSDFLSTMVGIHANSTAFEEVSQLLEKEREKEREIARRMPSPSENSR